MSEVAAMSAKRKQRLEQNLNGIKYTLEHWNGRNPTEMVKSVHEMTLDAIEVLRQVDPLLQRIGFVILALQQSSEVNTSTINGRQITRITIKDKDLYEWAMQQVHLLPEKLS